MGAALRLRFLEARRRGGLWLLAGGCLAILLVARFGGETADGRYGLATDLAAALTYAAALFYGAFPIAIDRERKRSYLPAASPVSPWVWGLGNSLGAAMLALLLGLALFSAAAIGSSLGGGIATHAVAPLNAKGFVELQAGKPRSVGMPEGAHQLRLMTRSRLITKEAVGTPDAPTLEVDGVSYAAFENQVLTVPVSPPRAVLANRSPEFAMWLVGEEVWALAEERSFLLNGISAGVPPALGAAALAAFGAVAGAHLSAPVAALLAALVLCLAAMKGFLLDTYTYAGSARAEQTQAHGHAEDELPPHLEKLYERTPDTTEAEVRDAARAAMKLVLAAVPDITTLDRTGRVAVGEWTGYGQREGQWIALNLTERALLLLAAALVLGATLGGLGVHLRRLP